VVPVGCSGKEFVEKRVNDWAATRKEQKRITIFLLLKEKGEKKGKRPRTFPSVQTRRLTKGGGSVTGRLGGRGGKTRTSSSS